jgi:hypothetical protein
VLLHQPLATASLGEEPTEIHASAHMHERGVDDLLVATMKFPSGVVASFTCE